MPTENVPASHIEDAHKLDADGYVEFFQIALADNSGTLYLKMNSDMTWQGHTYEGTGIKLDGVGSYADDQVSRPKLNLFNPDGIYSSLVDQGKLDNAIVTRIRVLKQDVDSNTNISRRQKWRISRIVTIKNPMIVCELRDMLDGQMFLVPGRMFIPPDFNAVSLS